MLHRPFPGMSVGAGQGVILETDDLDADCAALTARARGTRLFPEHRGFDPDDPVQQLARTIMSGGRRSHVIRRLELHLEGPPAVA